MTDLKKAITQAALTPDTVDAQFCSDWLKGQIKVLFFKMEQARDAHNEALASINESIEKVLIVRALMALAHEDLNVHHADRLCEPEVTGECRVCDARNRVAAALAVIGEPK